MGVIGIKKAPAKNTEGIVSLKKENYPMIQSMQVYVRVEFS